MECRQRRENDRLMDRGRLLSGGQWVERGRESGLHFMGPCRVAPVFRSKIDSVDGI